VQGCGFPEDDVEWGEVKGSGGFGMMNQGYFLIDDEQPGAYVPFPVHVGRQP
jgi:hypothetical protein